jgi:hypothetical protein
MNALLFAPWLVYAGVRFGLARVQVKRDVPA